jgi:hypothetical protein
VHGHVAGADEGRAQASVADVIPKLIDVHDHDGEAGRWTWVLTWAVVHDQPERRSSPAQESGKLVHRRWKAVPPQCFYLNQHRPDNALCARDERRRVGVASAARDGL